MKKSLYTPFCKLPLNPPIGTKMARNGTEMLIPTNRLEKFAPESKLYPGRRIIPIICSAPSKNSDVVPVNSKEAEKILKGIYNSIRVKACLFRVSSKETKNLVVSFHDGKNVRHAEFDIRGWNPVLYNSLFCTYEVSLATEVGEKGKPLTLYEYMQLPRWSEGNYYVLINHIDRPPMWISEYPQDVQYYASEEVLYPPVSKYQKKQQPLFPVHNHIPSRGLLSPIPPVISYPKDLYSDGTELQSEEFVESNQETTTDTIQIVEQSSGLHTDNSEFGFQHSSIEDRYSSF